jgi:hypothetical protein
MTKTLITTVYKEESGGKARAEIELEGGGYEITYYDTRGEAFQTESFPGKSLRYVEDTAENWALGIKVLNG